MNAPFIRHACPTLARPMQTGDGLLARLNPVAAGIASEALVGLAEAALRHGNGMMEVTARGNLQIRGLTPQSARLLAAEVDGFGIAVRSGVPVETGPLAGLDLDEIADPRPLADRIRAGIAAAGLESRLGPKVSVIADGGGRFGLHDVLADVRLEATRLGEEVLWRLAIAGNAATARPLGLFAESAACDAALSILREIAALGRKGRARHLAAGRLSMLPPSVLPDISPTRGEIGQSPRLQLPISPLVGEMSGRTEGGAVPPAFQQTGDKHDPFNICYLTDSRFVIPVGLPFGSIHASDLIQLIQSSTLLGLSEIRLAPQRRLLLFVPSEASANAVRDIASSACFITASSDPRSHIAACPGAPACASGHIPAREIASSIAANAASLPDLHISGCVKRCAAPRHDGLTLLGTDNALLLVLDGVTPRTLATAPKSCSEAAITHIASLLASERRPGEVDAALVERIGAERLAAAFSEP